MTKANKALKIYDIVTCNDAAKVWHQIFITLGVELGLLIYSIHKKDEHTRVSELDELNTCVIQELFKHD